MFISEEWGSGVFRYTITNGEYSASVLNYGAILQSYRFKDHECVLGFDSLDGYKTQTAHLGQVVGPFANRIGDASFVLDGKKYQLDRNDRGKNSLHSGSMNFGDLIWKMSGHSDSSISLSLRAGEKGGFDQNYEILVTYYLADEGELVIDYQMMSDKKSPVNLTNHAYFTLGEGDIRDTVVTFPSSEYVAVDDELIPVSVEKTAGTDYDFNTPHTIGERRDGKYDTCFKLEDGGTFTAEKNGLRLSMKTSLPAFQLYTGEFLTSKLDGIFSRPYTSFDGFAVESSYYPDFVNHPEYPGAYIAPGEVYRTATTYKLEEIEK